MGLNFKEDKEKMRDNEVPEDTWERIKNRSVSTFLRDLRRVGNIYLKNGFFYILVHKERALLAITILQKYKEIDREIRFIEDTLLNRFYLLLGKGEKLNPLTEDFLKIKYLDHVIKESEDRS